MDWFQQRAAASLLGSKGAPATPRLRSSCVSSAAGWFDALRRQAAATRQARPWLPCASTCADVAAARCWIVFPGSLRRPVARLVLMLFSAALGSRAPTSWQQRSKTLFLPPLQGCCPAFQPCMRAGFLGMLFAPRHHAALPVSKCESRCFPKRGSRRPCPLRSRATPCPRSLIRAQGTGLSSRPAWQCSFGSVPCTLPDTGPGAL
jgi:hypothetical protein